MSLPIVLRGGSVLDVATGESVRRDIHISDGVIVGDGQAGDADVLDLEGRTVMFGLWDCHAHPGSLMHDPSGQTFFEGPVRRAIRAGENMLEAARMGVTGIRCLAEPHDIDLAWAAAFQAGSPVGPRVVGAARAISTTGGHGTTWPRRDPDSSTDSLNGWTVTGDGPIEIARLVRRKAERGVQWIKLMLTGGLFNAREAVDDVFFTDEELDVAMATAREHRLPVAAHCGSPSAAVRFAKAGGRSIEHGYRLDDEAIDVMAKSQTWLVPTIAVTHDIEFQRRTGFPEFAVQKAVEAAPEHLAAVRACFDGGVPVATGADLGPIGPRLHAELRTLEAVGVNRLQILHAATVGGRSLVGLGSHTSPEPGAVADLVMLDGNPLDDLNILSQPSGVMAHGRFIVHPNGIGQKAPLGARGSS